MLFRSNDPTPGDGMSHEMNLQYSVTVDPEAYAREVRLCDTHLVFDGVAGGMGSYARVDETVWDLDRNQYLGNLSAYYHAGIVDRVRPIDIRDFCEIWGNTHGWRAFEVNKDMKFFARDAESFAMAGFVRQEFSQILAPSPGVAALVGLAGLLTRRRR